MKRKQIRQSDRCFEPVESASIRHRIAGSRMSEQRIMDSGMLPQPQQDATGTLDRILLWIGKRGDVSVGFRSFPRVAVAHVPSLAAWICPDNAEVFTGLQALVGHAGRYHRNISCTDHLDGPLLASEPNRCGAAVDAEDLVSCAVIVVIGIHPISPSAGPVVTVKKTLDG